MMSDPATETVLDAMTAINRTWLERRPQELASRFHPDITIVFPGFQGRTRGRDAAVAGFVEFCAAAEVLEYREVDPQAEVVGDTAVVSVRYEMLYTLGGTRYQAAGRDLWVFARHGEDWLAVWRTMLETTEQAV